jgi:2-polyprenyl-3-methyl-5-hydroxy-6-metoxy-1,4-benzoquinol methylase
MAIGSQRAAFGAWRREGKDFPTAPPCDICDGTRFDLLADRDRRGEVLHTGICGQCGLVRHLHVPSEEELAEFYAREYRQAYHGETTPSARRVIRAWNNAQRIFAQVSPRVARGAKVLEVGAGLGCTVKAFELAGYDASGIDLGESFLKFAVERLHARLARQSLYDLPQTGQYDLVLLIHVIEHFQSPRKALEHIHGLLKPGGLLYVECPNLTAPLARKGKAFHLAHICNFTPSSLRMLAGRCGFRVEQVFSLGDDPNLQVLLRWSAAPRRWIDLDNRSRTLAVLEQYGFWKYHLRWRYLARRAAKLWEFARERIGSRRQLQRIIAQCQGSSSGPRNDRSRATRC